MNKASTKLSYTCKLNVCFGYILQNKETDEFRYYYSSENTSVLPKPQLVCNFKVFKQKFDFFDFDIVDHLTNFLDNTKWSFYCLNNISLFATQILGNPMGNNENTFPDYIKNSHSVWTLEKNRDGQHYNDNLCFFDGVAAFLLKAQYDLANKTYELFQRYIEETQVDEARFDGTFLPEVPLLEEIFGLQF